MKPHRVVLERPGLPGPLHLCLARHPSESDRRFSARLLALAAHGEAGVRTGDELCRRDHPALWLPAPAGGVRLWVEVGAPSGARLRRALLRAERVAVYAWQGNAARSWWRRTVGELPARGRPEVHLLPPWVGEAVASLLAARLELRVSATGRCWQLSLNGRELTFAEERL